MIPRSFLEHQFNFSRKTHPIPPKSHFNGKNPSGIRCDSWKFSGTLIPGGKPHPTPFQRENQTREQVGQAVAEPRIQGGSIPPGADPTMHPRVLQSPSRCVFWELTGPAGVVVATLRPALALVGVRGLTVPEVPLALAAVPAGAR